MTDRTLLAGRPMIVIEQSGEISLIISGLTSRGDQRRVIVDLSKDLAQSLGAILIQAAPEATATYPATCRAASVRYNKTLRRREIRFL